VDSTSIKRFLQSSGLRCTAQRYAVLAFLTNHQGHPTAAEIFKAVNRVAPRSSRATTYNNLRDLVKAGLVREVAVEGRAGRFTWKGCAITISFVIAAAMLRTSTGTTCPGLLPVLWASELFVNASLFSADSARTALGELPVSL
jgi:hypothetical protein